MKAKNREQTRLAIIYIFPIFIIITIFYLVPIIMNIYYSFTNYSVLGDYKLIGFKNYQRMFSDKYVRQALKNTVIFTLITVPLQTIISLIIAAILKEIKSKKFVDGIKSALFIPVIASGILVGTVWSFILAPQGALNNLLNLIGISSINWFSGKKTAMLSICLASVWKNIGYFLAIYYAGIINIPKTLYEAAYVDGGSRLDCFFYITVPSLKNITYLVITLGTIWSFQVFDLVFVMTGGNPGGATMTLVLNIYNTAFKEYNMGYASTMALLLFVLILIVQKFLKITFAGNEVD